MTEDLSARGKINVDAALLAYLLPVVGPVYILALRKDDAFSRYHAFQSLTIVLALILAPTAWFLFSWLVSSPALRRRSCSIYFCLGDRCLFGGSRVLGGGNRQCTSCPA